MKGVMILKMKNSVKNIIVALCASTVLLASATVFAAPTTKGSVSASSVTAPSSSQSNDENEEYSSEEDYSYDEEEESYGEEEQQTEEDSVSNTTAGAAVSGVTQDSSKVIPTAVPVSTGEDQGNVVQTSEAQKVTNKKYASKGSVAFWIIFTILLNAVLSFLIGNRFYKLAKKESHVTAEIRALRRDIEEKFVNNVGGFNEMETDVTNTNDNYSADGSVNMPDRKSTDFATESEDVFKKWEDKMTQKRSGFKKEDVAEEEPEDIDDDYEEEEKPSKRKFKPVREKIVEDEEYDEDDDSIDDDSKFNTAKNKAKSFLNDIFPFKED